MENNRYGKSLIALLYGYNSIFDTQYTMTDSNKVILKDTIKLAAEKLKIPMPLVESSALQVVGQIMYFLGGFIYRDGNNRALLKKHIKLDVIMAIDYVLSLAAPVKVEKNKYLYFIRPLTKFLDNYAFSLVKTVDDPNLLYVGFRYRYAVYLNPNFLLDFAYREEVKNSRYLFIHDLYRIMRSITGFMYVYEILRDRSVAGLYTFIAIPNKSLTAEDILNIILDLEDAKSIKEAYSSQIGELLYSFNMLDIK